jgi:hypothetical protein
MSAGMKAAMAAHASMQHQPVAAKALGENWLAIENGASAHVGGEESISLSWRSWPISRLACNCLQSGSQLL